MKIAWVCDECNKLVISDGKEHHKMDDCPCGQCSVDLEEYGCRFAYGNHVDKKGEPIMPRIIAEFKDGDKWRYKRDK